MEGLKLHYAGEGIGDTEAPKYCLWVYKLA